MTAATLAPSAYPPSVDDLLPRARKLAKSLGEVPSRNRLKRELRIGSPKADLLREILTAELATPATVEPTPAPPVAPVLPVDPPAAEVAPAAPATVLEGHPADPGTTITDTPAAEVTAPAVADPRRPVAWPVLLLALPAFVAIWAGWVELGKLTGFGKARLLPGIADGVTLDISITLPVGMETYAAYALWVWLSGRAPYAARRFAKWSAIASLGIGAAGQVGYHLMAAAGWTSAPWPVTALVACLPVAVLGMGCALAHLLHTSNTR